MGLFSNIESNLYLLSGKEEKAWKLLQETGIGWASGMMECPVGTNVAGKSGSWTHGVCLMMLVACLFWVRTFPMGEHPCRGSTQHGNKVLCPPHLAVMLISYVTRIFAGLSTDWEKLSKYSSSWTFRFWQRGPTYSKGEIMHSGDPWARTSVCLTNIFFLF